MKKLFALFISFVLITVSAYAATTAQENALRMAKRYLSYTAFSRDGLIKQLEFEGFSNDEATYGVENCGADWYDQSVRMAKNYLDYTAFSKKRLEYQLIYEGFTADEAKYGADNCNANWFEEAIRCGEKYLKFKPFSERGLYDQLLYEQFSQAEVEYAINYIFHNSKPTIAPTQQPEPTITPTAVPTVAPTIAPTTAPTPTPAPTMKPSYKLEDISYNGKAITGNLLHVEGPESSNDLIVKTTFYLAGNTYMGTVGEVEDDGSFEIEGVGPIQYITIIAFEMDKDSGTTRFDAAELFVSGY